MKKFSIIILFLILFFTLFGNSLSPHDPLTQIIEDRLQTPNFHYWMGTDFLGRDLFSRIWQGARISLSIGIGTALFSLFFGVTTGGISGYYGGKIDLLLQSVMEGISIFPTVLLAILLLLLFDRSLFGIFLALGILTWIHQARVSRNLVLKIKEEPYIESAKAMGLSDFKILSKHILPHLKNQILVVLTYQIPSNVLAESFLSFIGLGVQPPKASWGSLAREGYRSIETAPHLILFPGGILFITMLAFHFLGDSLSQEKKIQISL